MRLGLPSPSCTLDSARVVSDLTRRDPSAAFRTDSFMAQDPHGVRECRADFGACRPTHREWIR